MYLGRQRHPVLVFFTVLANLFLIAFGLDATLSVLDDALQLSGIGDWLAGVRALVAGGVVLASFAMLFVMLFVPQLPRRILLPPALFAVWCALGAPPLSIHEGTGPILGVLQFALALGAFVLVNMHSGRWLILPMRLKVKGYLVVRTLAALAVTLVVVPVLLVSGGLVAFAQQIEGMSDHYVQFTGHGVDVQETTLTKGGQTVYLVGMMHIGEPTAYDALFASFPDRALVMPEGVSDRQNLLAGKFSYRRVARLLGLEQQPDIAAVESGRTSPRAPETGASRTVDPSEPSTAAGRQFLRADVDVSDFSDVTLRFLGDIGELYASASLGEALSRFQALSNNYSEDDIKTVFDDILVRRNAHLLEAFDANAASHDAVIIPWGALHMPGLEAALTARGYVAQSHRTIRLISYATLLAALKSRL